MGCRRNGNGAFLQTRDLAEGIHCGDRLVGGGEVRAGDAGIRRVKLQRQLGGDPCDDLRRGVVKRDSRSVHGVPQHEIVKIDRGDCCGAGKGRQIDLCKVALGQVDNSIVLAGHIGAVQIEIPLVLFPVRHDLHRMPTGTADASEMEAGALVFRLYLLVEQVAYVKDQAGYPAAVAGHQRGAIDGAPGRALEAIAQLHAARRLKHLRLQGQIHGTALFSVPAQRQHLALAVRILHQLHMGVALCSIVEGPFLQKLVQGRQLVKILRIYLPASLTDGDRGRSPQNNAGILIANAAGRNDRRSFRSAGDPALCRYGSDLRSGGFVADLPIGISGLSRQRSGGIDAFSCGHGIAGLSKAQLVLDQGCRAGRGVVPLGDADIIHIDGIAVFAGVGHSHHDHVVDLLQLVPHSGIGQPVVQISRGRHTIRRSLVHGLDRVPGHVLIPSGLLAGFGIRQLGPDLIVQGIGAVGVQADQLAVLGAQRGHEQIVCVGRECNIIRIGQLVKARLRDILQSIGQELMARRLFIHSQRQHLVALQVDDLGVHRFCGRRIHGPAHIRRVRSCRRLLKVQIQDVLFLRLPAVRHGNLHVVQVERAACALVRGQKCHKVLCGFHPADVLFHRGVRQLAVHIGFRAPPFLGMDIVRPDGVPPVRRIGTEIRVGFAVFRDLQFFPSAGFRLVGKGRRRIHRQADQLAGISAQRRQKCNALFPLGKPELIGHADLLIFAVQRITQDHVVRCLGLRRVHFQGKDLVLFTVLVQFPDLGGIGLRIHFCSDLPSGIRSRGPGRPILKVQL